MKKITEKIKKEITENISIGLRNVNYITKTTSTGETKEYLTTVTSISYMDIPFIMPNLFFFGGWGWLKLGIFFFCKIMQSFIEKITYYVTVKEKVSRLNN